MEIEKNEKKTAKEYDLFLISKYRNEIYGFSALWIALYHAFLCKCYWKYPLFPLRLGILGVEIFLFLSGISLYFSFTKVKNIRQFYKKRILRIVIPTLIILPYAAYSIFRYRGNLYGFIVKTVQQLPSLGFWLGINGMFWFTGMIIAAYLIYPIVYQLIFLTRGTSGQMIRTIIICLAETACILVVHRFFPDYYQVTRIALTRFPIFTVGCLAGRYVYEHRKIPAAFLYVCLFSCMISSSILCTFFYNPGFDLKRIVLYAITGVSLAVMLPSVFSRTEKTKLIIINKAFRILGEMSYEIYLVNVFIIHVYKRGMLLPYIEGDMPRYLVIMLLGFMISFLWNRVNRKIIAAIQPG